jgi:hypothetical protein
MGHFRQSSDKVIGAVIKSMAYDFDNIGKATSLAGAAYRAKRLAKDGKIPSRDVVNAVEEMRNAIEPETILILTIALESSADSPNQMQSILQRAASTLDSLPLNF